MCTFSWRLGCQNFWPVLAYIAINVHVSWYISCTYVMCAWKEAVKTYSVQSWAIILKMFGSHWTEVKTVGIKYEKEGRVFCFFTSRRQHIRGGRYERGYDSAWREGDVRYFLKDEIFSLWRKMESDWDVLTRVARSLHQQGASRKESLVSVDHLLLMRSHLPPHKALSRS